MSRPPATERLIEWCRIASDQGARSGLLAMVDAVADALEPVSGALVRERVGPERLPVICARSVERDGAPVLLVGHLDTVPHAGPGEQPEVRQVGERIYGRGTADMKGGLVVMVEALSRLEAEGRAPAWEVLVVPDEEIGTPWSRDILHDAARRARAALVLEPATAGGGVVRRRKGVGTVTIQIEGRAAHAGRNPQEGRSAIAALAALVPAIEALADSAQGTTVNVTTASGGSASNVIAAVAQLEADIRTQTTSEAERVLAGIDAAAEAVARAYDVRCHRTGGLHRAPMDLHPGSEVLFAIYRDGARAAGIELDWSDVGGGSDANIVAAAGVPILDGIGVRGGDLHGPSEYADIASIEERTRLLMHLLATLAADTRLPVHAA